jgi:hypothetical protein
MKRLLTVHLVQQMNGALDLGDGLDVVALKPACDLSEVRPKHLRSVRDFARKEWPLRGSLADVGCHAVLRSAGG